jgi:hypothetical protein
MARARHKYVHSREWERDPIWPARWQGIGLGFMGGWLLFGDGLGGLARWVAALVTGGP